MPKKMGINSKAVDARERKASAKKDAHEKAAKAADEALWRDDDKSLARKQSRKEEDERKKAELLRRKAENKALLDKEMDSIKTTSKAPQQKLSQAQIRIATEKRNKLIEELNKTQAAAQVNVVTEQPLLENLNYVDVDTIQASGIDEAIAALSMNESATDKHPEKRMKAAYKAFEEANLPRIKAENPSLRLSQWKQILFKEWQKSPENPLNAQF